MKKKIQILIKQYKKDIKGYKTLIKEYEERGLENLDSEEIEYYGAYLGKIEILEIVISDLSKI